MNMKDHILAALRDEFDNWEKLLSGLGEAQITQPRFDLDWSIKDVVAHLWAWQQISIARMEGGVLGRAPEYPKWIVESMENWEEDSDQVNALTFERYHEKSWSEIYGAWRIGFLRFLDLGSQISEHDLLDGDRYSWLHGYSLAGIMIASYDHHQEHIEKVTSALKLP